MSANNNSIDTTAQKAMQQALEAYKKGKASVKEFYPCSQEISSWLHSKADS
jgi:hypothetical protein